MWRRPAIMGTFIVTALLGGLPAATAAAQTTDRALVRLVNMSPDAPPVDLNLDGQPAATGVAFRSASPYAAQTSGTHDLRVMLAGQPAQTVVTANLPLQDGQALTLAAVGRVAELSLLPLQDDNSPPPPDKARVRFVHVVPDAPQVDVAVQGGSVLFPHLGFRGVSDYTTVNPGTYTLDVRPAGTATVAFTVPALTLRAGQVVTVFASGLLAQNSIRAIPIEYLAGPEAQVPVAMVHAGRGGPLGADTTLSPLERLVLVGIIGGLCAAACLVGSARRRHEADRSEPLPTEGSHRAPHRHRPRGSRNPPCLNSATTHSEPSGWSTLLRTRGRSDGAC
jgi:hypothetical protein